MKGLWFLAAVLLFSCAEPNAAADENKIQSLIKTGDWLKAEEAIRFQLQSDSSNIKLHILLADVLLKKENFSESFSYLEKARTLDSTNVEVNLKLSQFYLFLKKWDPAIARANDVLKVDRANAKAYFLKGMAFKDFGDTTKAVSNFQTSIEQDAAFYEAFIQLGLISAAKHDSSAIAYFNNALSVKPESSEALYGKAWFYQSHGKWNQALEFYQMIEPGQTHYFNAQYNSGYLFFNAKDYVNALKFFNEAAQHKIPKALYMTGLTFEAMGKSDSAQIYYRRCLSMDAGYAEAKKRLH
ncbi:MAG: tetratricopeptide repeat protein [Bacteroidetes bacterium]|nr:tetratricopeptide repeat protein [Bacteroidota bacterium]